MPTTGGTIRIGHPADKVFQLDFLSGLEVRRQRFNLTELDRVTCATAFVRDTTFPSPVGTRK